MKYLMILLFSLLVVTAYSEDFPIMLNVKSDVKIPDDFRDGVEESLTKLGYSLVDDKAQKEALKENAKSRNSECYDDECLVDTGKMLAARALISVEVQKKGDKAYKFKGKYIDFETGTTTKTKVMYYESKLDDFKALSKFGKEFSNLLLENKPSRRDESVTHPKAVTDTHPDSASHPSQEGNTKSMTKKEPHRRDESVTHPKVVTRPKHVENLLLKNKRYYGNWDITVALQGGSREYYTGYDIILDDGSKDFEKDDAGVSEGGGFSVGVTYRLKPWLGFYSNLNVIATTGDIGKGKKTIPNPNNNNEVMQVDVTSSSYTAVSTWLSLGTQFSFGDTTGRGLIYYSKLGLAFGNDQYTYTGDAPTEKEIGKKLEEGNDIRTFGVELEFGLNFSLSPNNALDVYLLMYYGKQLSGGREGGVNDNKIVMAGSHTFNAVLGVRYNLFTF